MLPLLALAALQAAPAVMQGVDMLVNPIKRKKIPLEALLQAYRESQLQDANAANANIGASSAQNLAASGLDNGTIGTNVLGRLQNQNNQAALSRIGDFRLNLLQKQNEYDNEYDQQKQQRLSQLLGGIGNTVSDIGGGIAENQQVSQDEQDFQDWLKKQYGVNDTVTPQQGPTTLAGLYARFRKPRPVNTNNGLLPNLAAGDYNSVVRY
jgi:lysozyme family protein